MVWFQVSCVLFMSCLTSLSYGDDSDFNLLRKSKQVYLSFQNIQALGSQSGDEIIEDVKTLEPNIVYYLHIEHIPDWVEYIVLQAHAYLHNITLSYSIQRAPHGYVTGQNIGLIHNVSTTGTAQLFLENDNPFNVTALIAAVAYNKSAPIPGGCNMEFEVETAPWLQVNVTGPMVIVSGQPAQGPRGWGLSGACDRPSIQYQAYHLYLPEKDFQMTTYFDHLRKMMTVRRITQNGRRVGDSPLDSPLRHVFSAYHGTGSVFALIASGSSAHAAYVPALTYTCSPSRYTDSCQVLTSAFSRSLCALVLFLGLFVCFFGHSFFQTELFLTSTLMGGILAYVLLVPLGFTDATNIVLATLGGVMTGNVWLLLWWVLGSPLVSIFMATLSLSFLVSSVAFYTVLGDLPVMESDINFWLGFLCCGSVVALLLAPHANSINIVACAVVGAYASIVPVDHYIGANLKYIFINTIRRATVPGFNLAIVDPPVQTKDGMLAAAWVLLAFVGFYLQSQRFGEQRPAFPRSEYPWSTPPTPRTPLLNNHQRPTIHSTGSDSVFT